MLAAALRDGTAHRRTTFEVFARRLPEGRRYGVVAGTARFVEALAQFTFDDAALASLSDFLDARHARVSRRLPVPRRRRRLRRGRAVLPRLPRAGGARHVSPNAWCWRRWRCRSSTTTPRSPRPRPGWSARPRVAPLIEMGSRRTHEQAAVAAARAAYLAGFTGSSNLEAQRRYGVPALGTSAHAFTLLHTSERRARRASRRSAPRSTRSASAPPCSSTPTTSPQGVANAVEVAGTELGAVRIDSGDLGVLARQVRAQLDGLGAHEDPHRGVGRPRRVRDRGAARRTRRHLRRRHLGGHRLGRPDREHGLQAGRGGRHTGREAQQPQGIPRRPQAGAAAGQAVGHHRRGGRPSRPASHRRTELVAGT